MMPLLLAITLQTPSPDIVVTGTLPRPEVARQVQAALPPTPSDQPLARCAGSVCAGVSGLAPASARAVADRIGVIARDLHLGVGAPRCAPNLIVMVVPDGRATVRRLVARRAGFFRGQSPAEVRRILNEPGRARAWVESEIRNRDGERPVLSPPSDTRPFGGLPVLLVQGSSRIALGFRRDAVSAVVVIDAAAAAGRDPVQIADYAAMRGLADARPGDARPGMTILRAFTPDDDGDAPATLTAFDRGVLHGLYRGAGNLPSASQRAAIVSAILDRPRAVAEEAGAP